MVGLRMEVFQLHGATRTRHCRPVPDSSCFCRRRVGERLTIAGITEVPNFRPCHSFSAWPDINSKATISVPLGTDFVLEIITPEPLSNVQVGQDISALPVPPILTAKLVNPNHPLGGSGCLSWSPMSSDYIIVQMSDFRSRMSDYSDI